MKYFSMIGQIDQAMLERFIDFYNNNLDSEVCIIINTSGGSFFFSETIIRMINLHGNVTLIIQGAYSAGLYIACMSDCKKLLSKSCRGMWHYGRWEISYNDKNKPYYHEDECVIDNMVFHKRYTEKLAKKIMTVKEFKLFKKDHDIYFSFTRMKQIFTEAKIM